MDKADNQVSQKDLKKIADDVAALEKTVFSHMSKSAMERYGRVRMAHPKKAMQALLLLASMVKESPKMMVDDTRFRQLLKKIKG